MSDLTTILNKRYTTSNYLEGGLNNKILPKSTNTGFFKNNNSINRYSNYYIHSYLLEFGVDVLRSPHSDKKIKINKSIIDILRYFSTPKYIKDFISENSSDYEKQKLLFLLVKDKFIFPSEVEQDRLFNLLYVEIDPNTVCNLACIYCPVSVKPREKYKMSDELFDNILSQISSIKTDSKIMVLLSAYNEITLDDRYPDFAKKIIDKGLSHTVVSNGSGLTPLLTDKLINAGVKDLELNIPALDKGEYFRLTGRKGIDKIIKNLDYLIGKPLNTHIIVHGTGNIYHYKNFTDIKTKFKETNISVSMGKTMDRAGNLANEYKCGIQRKKMCGCINAGSRLINWVHINAMGEYFLCPMDYDYKYKLGEISETSIAEILSGDKIALYRRYTYGLEEAPHDFICRKCIALFTSSWKDISEKEMTMYSHSVEIIKYRLTHKYRSMLFHLPLQLGFGKK